VLPPIEPVLPPALTRPPWLKLPAAPPTSGCPPQAVNMPTTTPAANLLSTANYTSFACNTPEALSRCATEQFMRLVGIMRVYLAFLVLASCGGSTDNGATAGGSSTGGRSYILAPAAGGNTYQAQGGVNTSTGGVRNTGRANPTGGSPAATGGASAVIGGSSSGVGGTATGGSSNGGTTGCVPQSCERACGAPVGRYLCTTTQDSVHDTLCTQSDGCGVSLDCYCAQ